MSNTNFDREVLNSMNDANTIFGFDTNKISIIKKDLIRKDFLLKSKSAEV